MKRKMSDKELEEMLMEVDSPENSEAEDPFQRETAADQEDDCKWSFVRLKSKDLLGDLLTHLKEDNSLLTYKSTARTFAKCLEKYVTSGRVPTSPGSEFFCLVVEGFEEGNAGATGVAGPGNGNFDTSILMVRVKEFSCVDDSLRKTKIQKPLRLLLSPESKLRYVFRRLVEKDDLICLWGGVRCDMDAETIITLHPAVCQDIVVGCTALKRDANGKYMDSVRIIKEANSLNLNDQTVSVRPFYIKGASMSIVVEPAGVKNITTAAKGNESVPNVAKNKK